MPWIEWSWCFSVYGVTQGKAYIVWWEISDKAVFEWVRLCSSLFSSYTDHGGHVLLSLIVFFHRVGVEPSQLDDQAMDCM